MSNKAAVLKEANTGLTIETLQIPKPGPADLLVKNRAIATNPSDWKMRDEGHFIESYPTVLGADIAGTVESVGSAVTGFNDGDRVAGFADVASSKDPRNGAFQQYTIIKACAATNIPDNITFEKAAILPVSVATAGMGIFVSLGIRRPPARQSGAFLVWGASSSVGTAVVQIAKSIGYTVYAVCSRRHHPYIKSLGSDACFDYHEPSNLQTIKNLAKASGQKINVAFDAISEHGSAVQAAEVLEEFGGGKLCLTLPYPETSKKPEGVEVLVTLSLRITTDQKEFGQWLFGEWLAEGLAKGTYVPSPAIEKVSGGLEGLQAALDTHKRGLSGKKLVLSLKD